MSVLATIPNVKIPYPTEGVIRTAQLDDTVAPTNSVQLAVNMNFDRVGALQTRPGVTQYANDLVDSINNYGTLRNSIIPAGFAFIFQFGSTSELSPNDFKYPSAVKVSDTKIAVFWADASNHGFAQNFSVDEAVGSVSPLGVPVEFETTNNAQNKAILVSTDVVLNAWIGTGNAAFAAGFNVAADTIVAGTPYQFDSVGFNFSLAEINSTHIICFYSVTGSGAGIATIFAINLTSLAVTEPGSPTTFDTGGAILSSVLAFADSFSVIRAINFWSNSGTGKAQCFSINTSTWAIAAIGSAVTFGSGTALHNAIAYGDNQHFIDIFQASSLLSAQAFELNLSTFAVSLVGTPLPGTIIASGDLTATKFDATHFVAFYSTSPGNGHVQMIQMSGSFVFSLIANNLTGYDIGDIQSSVALNLTSTEVMLVWGGFTTGTGKAAVFKPYGAVVNGQWLYAASGTSVFNTVSGSWVSRRSGLTTVSKARFAQYLNYIWMVNGNPQIGGDPVATSNGGAFGSDLVPANFPPADFIHAGFEGRVWVANKTLGTIYYTDIVQFIPPSTYLLSYNPDVNFISELAPQTGQSFTALQRVPRALLVFTQDTITRIYGATSVDAYPAYNVGTFSQESIIETKTGIFFHHSSGFYQFDYGSQPVEISRRIIDFVRAIPRSYYDSVTGVYDGFDCVEWSVGQVVVEGVVFVNCVLRYTISTQVWTVYDYPLNVITAMIFYDDGTNLNHLAGMTNTVSTAIYKTGALDTGATDFGQPFYFEFIDRWRAFTDMYYQTKSLSGLSVYSENAAGANLTYQKQKSGPNAWIPIGTVDEGNNAIMPNSSTEDFDVMRLRLAGTTKGAQIVVHGIEITQLTIKGQEEN